MQELTGAYAVDALDASEAEAVERHLAGCPRCRREVAELREVAALLAFAGGPAPARVWDGIATEVVGAPEAAADPVPPDAAAAGRKAVSLRVFTAVVALAALVTVALGVQISRTGARSNRAPSAQAAWGRAIARPDARALTLRSPDGSRSAMAVVLADGRSYLGPNNLPALSDQRSYQLWGQVGSNMVSLAVMRTPAAYQQFSTPAETMALVITDEPASGVISTTRPPVVSTPLPAAAAPRP